MSLSPTCTISGGPTPADIAASSTINGALAAPSGALFWGLKAISCDDVTGPAGLALINASLVVNQTNKTFSFTSPANVGTAVIFQSTVGVSPLSALGTGRDANGSIVAAWTTTFKVNVPAANGNRVLASLEVAEQDPVNGWTSVVNAGLRTAGGGGSGYGSTTTGTFTRPAIGATSTVGVLDTTNATPTMTGGTVGAHGPYLVTARSTTTGAGTITLFNAGGDAGSGTVAPGAVVTFGASTLPIAQQQQLPGQVLANAGGLATPQGHRPVLNALSLGCKDDNSTTDNWGPAQNAIDGQKTAASLDMYFPYTSTGAYYFSQPIFFSPAGPTGGVRLRGDQTKRDSSAIGVGNTYFVQSMYTDPITNNTLWIGPNVACTTTIDPPFVKIGNIYCWQYETNSLALFASPTLLLKETGVGNINALAQLDVALFFDPLTGPAIGNNSPIVGSRGGVALQAGASACLDVYNIGGVLQVNTTLTTSVSGLQSHLSGGTYPLAASALSHIELSYDGTTCRTLIDQSGTMQVAGSFSASGTVVQKWYEDFTIGYSSSQWPCNGAVNTASNGQLFGSIRICSQAQHTSSYATPTTNLAMVASQTTLWLQNFDPSYRSTTLTATANNPGGHQGYVKGFTNWTRELSGYLLPDAGTPVWTPWHGLSTTGFIQQFTFEDLCFVAHGTGLCLQSTINTAIRRCTFVAPRCISLWEYSYKASIDECNFNIAAALPSGVNGQDYTCYSWGVGAFSEQTEISRCNGGGGLWTVASTTFDCHLAHCYFDSNGLGVLYGNGSYNIHVESCYLYQEFNSMLVGNVFLAEVGSFYIHGGAVSCLSVGSLPLFTFTGFLSAPTRTAAGAFQVNTYMAGAIYQFSFAGTYWADPVLVNSQMVDVTSLSDPGISGTSILQPGGNVGPILMQQWEDQLIVMNFSSTAAMSIAGNDAFFGEWEFTDTSLLLSATTGVVIPYNLRGRKRLVRNSTTVSLSITGPDAGTPIVIAPGKSAWIQCTETYIGTGTMRGTWRRSTLDA